MSQAATATLATRSLGEIAANPPGATTVFHRYKLDFCRDGAASLAEVARDKGLDPTPIEAELAALSDVPSAPPESVEDLIQHIIERYHAVHRRELPELRRLASRIESLHAAHTAVSNGLADRLAAMQSDLESHMQKEEQILLPLMRAGGSPMIVHPIAVMRAEHDEAGGELQALAAVTVDLTLRVESCSTWRALYAGIEKFAKDLTEHIHIENNILFPRLEG